MSSESDYLTKNRSIVSSIGDKYAPRIRSISVAIPEDNQDEGRNPEENYINNRKNEKDDDSLIIISFSDNDGSCDNDEASVISATSAVVSLSNPPSNDVVMSSFDNRKLTQVRTRQSDISGIMMSRSTSSASSNSMNRSLSTSSASSNLMNQSLSTSPQSKPSTVLNRQRSRTNTKTLDSTSTIDSQELYALSMVEGYKNNENKELIQKPVAKHWSKDMTCEASIDSQEQYAMTMTYGSQDNRNEQMKQRKKRPAWVDKMSLKRQLAKERKATKREFDEKAVDTEKEDEAELQELETVVDRKQINTEESLRREQEAACEEELRLAKESVAMAEQEMMLKIEEQQNYEAQLMTLEHEEENARSVLTRNIMQAPLSIVGNNSKITTQYSESDYSSESYDSDETDSDEDDNGEAEEETIMEEEEEDNDDENEESDPVNEILFEEVKEILTNVSSVSGSEDEKQKTETKVKQRKKKNVIVASKGIGKDRVKEITNRTVIKKKRKKNRISAWKTTAKHVKSTTLRKTGIKKKKVVSQMITIRERGKKVVDDIIATTNSNTKVMRVCRLTSKGYISAEFTSIDPRNTPLHIACLTHYPEKFILDHLMESDYKGDKKGYKHNAAIQTENSSGELPIHYAVMDKEGVPHAIIDALLSRYPDSVKHCNIDGSLPIHVACEVGAPSLYAIQSLCKAWPDSVLTQNDLQVKILNDDEEEKLYESQLKKPNCLSFLCFDVCGINWFGGNEIMDLDIFETGWTPLHLASLNGAKPEVIETIIETRIECMGVKTNKGRTALECAKWCVINALINDVSVSKLQNTMASIQIMQSYERELRVKEELVLKVGLIMAASENSDTFGEVWERTIELLPKKDTGKVIKRDFDIFGGDEAGLTELHRVILSRGPPEDVQVILEDNPKCLDIATTHGRSAIECAKHIIIKGLLLGLHVSDLTNTFISLEVMQAFEEDWDNEYELDATSALSQSVAKRFKEYGTVKFGSKYDNYNYTKTFVEMVHSALGNYVSADDDSAIQPHEYYPPANLSHVNLRISVPVGYRRFRRAFLNYKETFLSETVLAERMGYSE